MDRTSLISFPHPSGGNAHPKRQYVERQEAMADAVAAWFGAAEAPGYPRRDRDG
jgi:hypothetical protein